MALCVISFMNLYLVEARWQGNLLQSDSLLKLSEKFLNDENPSTASNRWKFDDCGLTTDAITIKSFDVEPDPPKAGKNLTVTASGTVNQVIEDGAYADVTVKLGSFIKLLQKTFDICEELTKSDTNLRCPIQPGDYDIAQTVALPREIPPAKYTVQVRAFTANDEDLACADLMVDFSKF
ncbi:ML domain-containing protein [Phakopsora pachyrhizi]|nr:ML domain-containing protein [Phakopsora pachyrhizi]